MHPPLALSPEVDFGARGHGREKRAWLAINLITAAGVVAESFTRRIGVDDNEHNP